MRTFARGGLVLAGARAYVDCRTGLVTLSARSFPFRYSKLRSHG